MQIFTRIYPNIGRKQSEKRFNREFTHLNAHSSIDFENLEVYFRGYET